MLKHSDIIQKLNILQKVAVISSALREEPFVQAEIPPVRAASLAESGKKNGVSYASAARSWNPELIGKMTEELVLDGARDGNKLFITPDLKTAINPYKEGLSEDPMLNGAIGAEILRAVKNVGAASGLYRPSVGENETDFLDGAANASAVNELLVKPFIKSVEECPCDAVYLDPSREGGGYLAVNRAIFNEVKNGLFGDAFIVGEGDITPNDAVSLLSGKLTLGGCAMPLEKAARRYIQLKGYEDEGSISHREIEDSLYEGSAVDEKKLDEILDEIIDFALKLDELEISHDSFAAPEIEEKTVTQESDTGDTDMSGEPESPQTDEAASPVAEAETEADVALSPESEAVSSEDSDLRNFDGDSACERLTAESMVLLKNNGVLPLKEGSAITVLGETYSDLSFFNEKFQVTGAAKGYDGARARSDSYLPTALRISNKAEYAVVFLTPDATGRELALPPNRIALLDALKRGGKKIIAVVTGDLPTDMSFDRYADGLILAPSDGPFCGRALARVICGDVNPSGKLVRTSLDGADGYFRTLRADRDGGRLRVGSFIGYRRHETEGASVRYPFGFGLSYTQFVYSDLKISSEKAEFTLTNKGKRDGFEVVQLYIGAPSVSQVSPKKQLRGFKKIFLRAGESKKISLPLDSSVYESYDCRLFSYNVEEGEYMIYVGSSVRDIRLEGKVSVSGVKRASLNEKRSEYFPDDDFGDGSEVGNDNRIRAKRENVPEKLKNARTAALYITPLIALVFFLLVSVLILSYALDYILLSFADAAKVEWCLYVIAVGMLALVPLLGSLNRKRLIRIRTVSIIIAPVLLVVCFVLGGILLSENGGIAEEIALRVITCFAVGVPICALVAIRIERQLWRTKKGKNRWDKYYFTREKEEKITEDGEFEEAFKITEEAHKRRTEELPDGETAAPVREVVRFYDKQLSFVQMLKDLDKFLIERGLWVEQDSLKSYIAAIFSSRLIVVPSDGGAALCEAVAEYFGKNAYIDNAEKYERYGDLFTQWRQSGNASYPTNLSAAMVMARRESAYLHTVLIRHVKNTALSALFAPFADVLSKRRETLPVVGGKEITLPPNVLIVVETDNAYDIPAVIAEVASVVSPVCEVREPSPYKTMLQSVGYERMESMTKTVRDYYPLDEELWKRVDRLDDMCRTAHIGNRLWLKLETHSSVMSACGDGSDTALDGAIATELLPWLSAVWNGEVNGNLHDALSEIFGEGNIKSTMAALKGGESQ